MSSPSELILNVDDSEAMRYAKTRALRNAGFEVIEAANGRDALDLANARDPALVLLDVNLPDISGIEICKLLKRSHPSLIVLQTSASAVNPGDRVLGLDSGADSYLIQPAEPDELVATTRALLRLRTAETALRLLNETLEQRIEERTGELAEANRQLKRQIEERQVMEEALRQSQKMEALGQLTGGIAHDFNNLLTAITGNLSLLLRRLAQDVDPRIRKHAEYALVGADRAATLTQRLLAFSRRQALNPSKIDLNALVEETAELIRRTVGEQIEVETVLSEGVWYAWCDANQLINAVLNLAINARDAMPDGGRLTVSASNTTLAAEELQDDEGAAPGDFVMVSVTDTGSGMPPEVMARAFDPFFTTKPIGQGTGLGLSMVYGFLKQSRGYARITSREGVGTTVRLYVPRHGDDAKDDALPERAHVAHAPAGSGRILLVEDEVLVRELIATALEEAGYVVVQSDTAYRALELLNRPGEFKLLITDIGLPGMNGRQLAERVRMAHPQLKIIFTTGYAPSATLKDIKALSGVDVVRKPFVMADFLSKIEEFL